MYFVFLPVRGGKVLELAMNYVTIQQYTVIYSTMNIYKGNTQAKIILVYSVVLTAQEF